MHFENAAPNQTFKETHCGQNSQNLQKEKRNLSPSCQGNSFFCTLGQTQGKTTLSNYKGIKVAGKFIGYI